MANRRGQKGKPVGYKSPPVEHQFKKGEPSRNPKGRPHKPRTTQDAVLSALDRKVSLAVDGGRRKRVPLRDALSLRLVQAAMSGDVTEMIALLKLVQGFEAEKDRVSKAAQTRAAEPTEQPWDERREFVSLVICIYEIAQGMVELGGFFVIDDGHVRVAPWLFEFLMSRRSGDERKHAGLRLRGYVSDQPPTGRQLPDV